MGGRTEGPLAGMRSSAVHGPAGVSAASQLRTDARLGCGQGAGDRRPQGRVRQGPADRRSALSPLATLPPRRRTSPAAAALVLALIPGITAPVGFLLGLIALSRIRASGGHGRWPAAAAVLIGGLFTLALIKGHPLSLPLAPRSLTPARPARAAAGSSVPWVAGRGRRGGARYRLQGSSRLSHGPDRGRSRPSLRMVPVQLTVRLAYF
jgi:hypothetical protein